MRKPILILGTLVCLLLVAMGVAQSPHYYNLNTGTSSDTGWTAQTSGITSALNSVFAVNSSVVWAAGGGGVVLRTTDGGTNWSNVGGGAIGTQDLNAMDAISATTAFVAGTPSTTSYIFRTTNGGASWDTVFAQPGGFINAIKMYDANNGIAMGDPVGTKWVIIRTTDGGSTWARIPTEPDQVGTEFGFAGCMATVGTTHIWFCADRSSPKVYRSTDAGDTWASSPLPWSATGNVHAVSFVDAVYGVAGGNAGFAARSTDGGATWNGVTVGSIGMIGSADAAGTLDFWATRGPTIHRSTDCGATWTQEFSDTAAGGFSHVSFVTSGSLARGWAVSGLGMIYSYVNPVTPTDVESAGAGLPSIFVLEQNYPNPFNPSTTIRYSLPRKSMVQLAVFNTLGQHVATLVQREMEAGYHGVRFDATGFSSGVYFYRLQAGDIVQTHKMLVVR
jgi:photosystem II stability/assembly factor-like uncharacterized protein